MATRADESMAGTVCVVTGATSGIGRETALSLTRLGATVVAVGRNPDRGRALVDEGRRQTGRDAVTFVAADLSDQAQIRRLVQDHSQLQKPIDVLINNAGGMFGTRQLSRDGVELTFALNHLSYMLLTHLLMPALRAASSSRIVNVASNAHKGVELDFDDLQFERRYQGWTAYKRSKLANIMFTYALSRRLRGTGVTANALHPGFVATDIGHANRWTSRLAWRLVCLAAIPVQQGAETPVYLAASQEVEGVSGRYFDKCRPTPSSPFSNDEAAAERLWTISAGMLGIREDVAC